MLMRAGREGIRVEPELSATSPWCGAAAASSARPFLGKIKEAFDKNPQLDNLLLDDFFTKAYRGLPRRAGERDRQGHRNAAFRCPHSRALVVLRRLSRGRLPANLLQAQRDYFGAHTYERVDKPARRVVPHQLDRQGRQHLCQHLHSLRPRQRCAAGERAIEGA